MQEKRQIKDVMLVYEAIWKARSAGVIKGSNAKRDVYQMRDGVAQQKRDHELRQAKSSDWFLECIGNPGFQSWLLGYDTESAVGSAWRKYQGDGLVASRCEDGDGVVGA